MREVDRRGPTSKVAVLVLAVFAVWLTAPRSEAEIIYFKNGDVLHGSVVAATEKAITLRTPYGRIVIPTDDVLRIDYQGEKEPATPGGEDVAGAEGASVWAGGTSISLDIRGQSFWYAFHSPDDDPADLSIRLRLYLGEVEVVRLQDSKPDTVDGSTYYNSFTFSPSDSQIVRTADGYGSTLEEVNDGRVVMRLEIPEDHPEGQLLLRMVYQINEGSEQLPYWTDAVERSFSVQVQAGKDSYVVVEQDAAGLEYSGFFRKRMRNLESFRLTVLSAELRDPEAERDR